MSDYILSCSSTADLSKEHFISRDIKYICFHYEIDGKQMMDDLGESMPFDEFYKRMSEGANTRTSQINISEYVDYFTAFLDKGLDIVHVTLSSGISGTYNSAVSAANVLRERFPDRSIYIVDSLSASSGYGLLMDTAADMRDSGLGAGELAKWIEDNRLRLNHWFFSTDLTSYVRGGRISKAAGIFGGLLEICPLLNVDDEGRLIPRYKIRTKKKVILEITAKMKKMAQDGTDYSGKCFISNSACLEDAQAVASIIENAFPRLNGRVQIFSVGTTIGAHTGPGTVALFFWGDTRNE